MKSARAQNRKTASKTKKDIESAYANGASSKEEKRAGQYGDKNAMEEAKANIASRRMSAAGMDFTGKPRTGVKVKTFAEVSGENRDMRSPEKKAKDIAAASAGRSNADIAASAPAPSASAVMQDDKPRQSAFSGANRTGSLSSRQASSAGKSGNLQANRTGSLSSRSTRQVGRGYYSDERAGERANRRNEEASRRAYGF